MSVEISCPSAAAEPAASRDRTELGKPIVAVCAIGCGLSVANVYYAQPLLDLMANDFGISPATIGVILTLTQLGYALGLIFVVPLGDLVDPRSLAVTQTAVLAVTLAVVGLARTEAVLFAAMVAVGLMSVVVQVLVAYAASLAEPAKRGQVVGIVTSGVVIGILCARIVSGFLSDLGGWRTVYLASAGSSVLLSAALAGILPRGRRTANTGSYLSTVRSVPLLFMQDPVLRLRAGLALLIFATFSTFWTALVLPLSAATFQFSHTQIGAFGLVGIAGAVAAARAGRLADRGLEHWGTGIGLTLLLIAWVPIALLPISLAALIGGVVLLDLAVQAVHVTNQSVILARHPQARSRLIGGYMAFYSIGSGVGASAGTTSFAFAGWTGVCAVGAVFSSAALLIWLRTADDRSNRPDPLP